LSLSALETLGAKAISQVLADYVLALIRVDTEEAELKINAIDSLEDFLKDGIYCLCGFTHKLTLVLQIRQLLSTKFSMLYEPDPTRLATYLR